MATASSKRIKQRVSQSKKLAARLKDAKAQQLKAQKARESASKIDQARNARRGTGIKNVTPTNKASGAARRRPLTRNQILSGGRRRHG